MSKKRMICNDCGSEDVQADAYAEWNVKDQKWEVSNRFEKGGVCAHCDGECRIEDVGEDEFAARQKELRAKHIEDYGDHCTGCAPEDWGSIGEPS